MRCTFQFSCPEVQLRLMSTLLKSSPRASSSGLPNSWFPKKSLFKKRNKDGSIFAWLFVWVFVRHRCCCHRRCCRDGEILQAPHDLPVQLVHQLDMVELPKTMVDIPNTMVNLSNTMQYGLRWLKSISRRWGPGSR